MRRGDLKMKQYIKPTADVVELSVRENIAALPTALTGTRSIETVNGVQNVILTTYNLAAASTSESAQG